VTVSGADGQYAPRPHSGRLSFSTHAGSASLVFEIEADSLKDALDKFPDGVKGALEQAIDEAREMRREQATRIVVPEVGGGMGPRSSRVAGRSSFLRRDSVVVRRESKSVVGERTAPPSAANGALRRQLLPRPIVRSKNR